MMAGHNRVFAENIVSSENPTRLEDMIHYGRSVRDFFYVDLQAIAPRGYCLLPEWICQSMVDSVYAANWQPLFYPVLPPAQASMILQADIQALMKMLIARPQPCAVLLAHPLGYIDPGCLAFLRQMQNNHQVHVFLDLSQGYGRKDCLQEILHVSAAYYSFNGNKLIGTGGALRLRLTGRESVPSSVINILTIFSTAAEEKFSVLRDCLKTSAIEDDIRDVSLYVAYQSSPYRTVLNWGQCSSSLQTLLKRLGLIQPLLAEPRQEKGLSSTNYHQWCEKVMLMFSSPRVEWSQ
ncbi:hypothetical protein [Xenorhabdus szentirmaii]|uniref:Aminotransferase class I/classII domain-containing protein n=1 Tax=Xenorhabdus szentirmaii DSM 16338 TaxID=1427518 RepID=W1IVQ4_9GAMM|nr:MULTISPECIES: hypothetical protein [unclassified Xenorhabdus]MBD2782011.1 hypothetical protein [Xenorhabdus sp. 38]MBD2824235.1 hypothetical protein [Xenorhabdus sp. 5]PHM35146.1 hypothetical protein Xsze_01607 [Xenorhabdus szentirmaii DSM 16338]CDL81701.1 hypothetical protein XSR1_150048 [Xenorhabdus szentirmaii DSM 16338]